MFFGVRPEAFKAVDKHILNVDCVQFKSSAPRLCIAQNAKRCWL